MDEVKDHNRQIENISFFQQALGKAIIYRLSFAKREMHNHQALEREMPNLWEAARQCYQQKAWDRLSAFRDALQPFLDLRGYWPQSLLLNEWAREAAQARGDSINAARWTHDRADILHQQGKYHDAETLYQASEEAYRGLGENEMALKSRHMRSIVVRAQGRVTEAQHLCETTISEARILGLDQWLANPLYALALLTRDQGNLRKAEQYIKESLHVVDPNDIALIGHNYHFLGEIALLQGNLAKARIDLEKSLQLSEQVGIMRRIAATKRLLGDLSRAEGQYEEAEKIYGEALEIVTRIGDRPVLARLLLSKAKLMIQLKQTKDAVVTLRGVITIYKEIGDARSVGGVSLLLIRLYLGQGNFWQVLRVGITAFKVILSSDLLRPRVLFNVKRLRVWWTLLTSLV
jgi:tetratricopeptide (TPR) repeat protein